MYRWLLILTSLVVSETAFSQTTEDSVKAVVNAMFAAMKNADSKGLRNTFSPTVVLQTIEEKANGVVDVVTDSVEEFASMLDKVKPDMLDERIRFEKIYIDGPLAMAWTPYQFYYMGKFSHCGVNSFQLVRINNEWKIQYIIDTRRKAGCIE